jgi:AAA domain
MSKLRAIKPEVKEIIRTKMLLYGREKVGKTTFALSFPKVYFFDTEGGAVREQYQKKLLESGGVYFGQEQGSLDFKTVIEEIITLATEKHDYKTLVIDSFSKLYNTARAIAEEDSKIGSAFGADKKEANKPTRQLIRWLDKIDMNVILICHRLDKWEGTGNDRKITGSTFDGFDKFNYELDLLAEAVKINDQRKYMVKASRVLELPEGLIADLDFQSFANVFGIEKINKEQKVYLRATAEQVGLIQELIKRENISSDAIQKWLQKMNCEDVSEIPTDRAQAFIDGYSAKEKENHAKNNK